MPKTIIIAYVPVIHAGYKKLFDAYPDAEVWVLGPELIATFDQLRKELRSLKPEEAVKAIEGLGRTAKVVEIGDLASMYAQIVMPDEDISHELAELYFSDSGVTYATVFLRWDRRKMEAESDPVVPDAVTSVDELDRDLMKQAWGLGKRSSNLYRRMGAVIAKNGEVIVSGFNSSYPTAHTSWIDGDPRNNANRGTSIDLTTDIHAEARAITEAARDGVALGGASMYVLDFPCPTCAKLVANSGIAKLYYVKGYSVLDGQQALNAAGVEIIQVKGVKIEDPDPSAWVPYPEKQK